jgi:hypothetical protein
VSIIEDNSKFGYWKDGKHQEHQEWFDDSDVFDRKTKLNLPEDATWRKPKGFDATLNAIAD